MAPSFFVEVPETLSISNTASTPDPLRKNLRLVLIEREMDRAGKSLARADNGVALQD